MKVKLVCAAVQKLNETLNEGRKEEFEVFANEFMPVNK